MAKADLHVHTRVSDGLASIEEVLEHAEHHTDLDIIAVTDHEDARGGLRARELAAKRGYRVQVVPGVEVTTIQGHLIGLFVENTPKSFRRVESTLEAIHRQGGVAVIPHPMSWLTRSLSRRTIDRICAAGEPGVTFDAIETCNPSPAGRVTGVAAAALNRERWQLLEVGASDAHHLLHMATGWTEFEGKTSDDLRQSLLTRTAVGYMGRYPSVRQVGVFKTALGLAWGYAATPRKLLGMGPGRAKDGS